MSSLSEGPRGPGIIGYYNTSNLRAIGVGFCLRMAKLGEIRHDAVPPTSLPSYSDPISQFRVGFVQHSGNTLTGAVLSTRLAWHELENC